MVVLTRPPEDSPPPALGTPRSETPSPDAHGDQNGGLITVTIQEGDPEASGRVSTQVLRIL